MVAKVLAVVNQKGGCGKSTVSLAIGCAFVRTGRRVVLLDADRQMTAWCVTRAAAAERPFPVPVRALGREAGSLADLVAAEQARQDLILIDGPPSHESPYTRAAMALADLVLIPVKLGGPDIWSAGNTIAMVQELQAKAADRGPPAFLLANEVRQTTLAKEVRANARTLGVPFLVAALGKRVAFEEMTTLGLSIYDTRSQDAIREVNLLARELTVLLNLD